MKVRYGRALGIVAISSAKLVWAQSVYTAAELVPPKLCVAEQVIQHSNLFRLNDGADVQQRLGAGASRADTTFQTSACANTDWQFSQQQLALNLSVDDNRYLHNDLLNHTSGLGRLQWNWRTAGDWYGKLGGSYRHALATFTNDRPLVKDLVDSYQYFGDLTHDVGAYVKLNLGGTRTDTSHSAEQRRIDDYRSTTGTAGITLTSLAENYLGANFQRTRANYPVDALIDTTLLDRDYQEDTTSLRFGYALTGKTLLRGSAGYLQRDYPRAADNDYSGNVWRVGLDWAPRNKLKFEFAAWKELSAYFDSEADHFVSRGGGVTFNWTPRDKLKFAAATSWAEQEFIAQRLSLPLTASRTDQVFSAGVDALYQPLDFMDVAIRYSHEQNDSDLAAYEFVDDVVSLRLRARF